jgi:hypothetical protein
VSAAHTREQIGEIIARFATVAAELNQRSGEPLAARASP